MANRPKPKFITSLVRTLRIFIRCSGLPCSRRPDLQSADEGPYPRFSHRWRREDVEDQGHLHRWPSKYRRASRSGCISVTTYASKLGPRLDDLDHQSWKSSSDQGQFRPRRQGCQSWQAGRAKFIAGEAALSEAFIPDDGGLFAQGVCRSRSDRRRSTKTATTTTAIRLSPGSVADASQSSTSMRQQPWQLAKEEAKDG